MTPLARRPHVTSHPVGFTEKIPALLALQRTITLPEDVRRHRCLSYELSDAMQTLPAYFAPDRIVPKTTASAFRFGFADLRAGDIVMVETTIVQGADSVDLHVSCVHLIINGPVEVV